MAKKEKKEDVVGRVLAAIEEDIRPHDAFRETVEKRYRAYDGVIEKRSRAADWTNKYAPHYAFQIVETMVAALIDPKRRWAAKARSRLDSPDALTAIREGARSLEILLGYQIDEDKFFVKQRAHRLQGLIGGTTAWKTCWAFEEHERFRNHTIMEDRYDDYGFIGQVPIVQPVSSTELVRDDPSAEVVDIRHLIWPKNATSVDNLSRVTHRVFYSFDELKRLEAQGVYENVDQLKENQRGGEAADAHGQEDSLFRASPSKDDITVLEHWSRNPDGSVQLTALGNRKVLLRNQSSPFWHGQFPFVICSGLPYPFRLAGKSEIEVIAELQEMMWTLQNQQLDNLMLLNNAIVLISEDVDDVDSFEWAPGERWIARQDQVSVLEINPITAELASAQIARVRADMQATSGGTPWLSGDNQAANTDTATEASLLTSLAQRRVAAKKHFYDLADAQVGEQFIELNQQFLDRERYVEIVGPNGEPGLQLIQPDSFNGYRFKIDIEAMDESLMRQERRSEAIAKLNAVANVAAQMVGIPGQPTPNIKQYVDDILREFGVDDTSRYWATSPPPQAAMAVPGTGGQNGQPGMGGPGDPNSMMAQQTTEALRSMMASGGGAMGGPNSG